MDSQELEFIQNFEDYEFDSTEKQDDERDVINSVVKRNPTMRDKRNKRSRYLDGIRLARRHWARMFEERNPGSSLPRTHEPRRVLTSWMSEEEEDKYHESVQTLENPAATPKEKWRATVTYKFKKSGAERKMRNFGKFRKTRPNIGKDAIWDTMVHNTKQQRQKDSLDDNQKDFDSMLSER